MALSPKQKRFVEEYLVDLNATQAAIRAGYSVRTATETGYDNLRKPQIAEAIEERQRDRSVRTEITQDMVLQHWYDLATADPNELTQLRRLNCRHCHGIGYQYQWIDHAEYERAVRAAMIEAAGEGAEPSIPSDAGGYGFYRLGDPHPRCPACLGEGVPDLHLGDTRRLSRKGRLLFAGIKQTQAGIEIKMHDQSKALELVARHLGMLREKVEVTGDAGGPLQVVFSPKMRAPEDV